MAKEDVFYFKATDLENWETAVMASLDIRVITVSELPSEEKVLMAREDYSIILLGELLELKETEEARAMQQEDALPASDLIS